MENKEWLDLIDAKEDEIIEALEEAYGKACGAHPDLVYVVELHRDGNLSLAQFIGNNNMSECVWKGEAIEIARAKGFDPTDGDDFDYFPDEDASLSDAEKAAFKAWGEAEGYSRLTPAELRDWNEAVYYRWLRDYESEYAAAYADEWAREKLEQIRHELRARF